MKLPQPLLHSLFFQFKSFDELSRALANAWEPSEANEARRVMELGLPPATSVIALATMLGLNPGLVWSMRHRPHRYYRSFSIPKGKGIRNIDAPRILLKIIQKWMSVHLQRVYAAPDHVYGFVPNKSHVQAAAVHCGAHWVFSLDIADFFPSTPEAQVILAFQSLGYSRQSADLLSKLTCLRGGLAQGAPTSPVLSNVCMADVDRQLAMVALTHGLRLTRYADDIVLSGTGDPPANLKQEVRDILKATPWRVAEDKVSFDVAPARLKVHGLLVHGNAVRLTKGYRNRIRAYHHLMNRNAIREEDLSTVRGHLEYSRYVDQVAEAADSAT
jgi:RNA-directed DNA polymerase